MPIDFGALPPRAAISDARKAIIPWLIALIFVLSAGAAISIMSWPAGRPTQTLWFWIRTFGLPLLVWLFSYSSWRFMHANRLRNALVDNAAIDGKERQLHADASVPLMVIGESWRTPGIADQGGRKDVIKVGESDKMAELCIPGTPFFLGNSADEVHRHAALLEWLLVELLRPLVHELKDSRTAVWLCLDSMLSDELAKAAIARAWAALGLGRPEKVQLREAMTLYAIDGWLDGRTFYCRHLAIAVQLRSAISGELRAGQAEAGAAVLLGGVQAGARDSTALVCAHRPARCRIESLDKGIANALRWGHSADGSIETTWNSGLDEPLAKAFRSLGTPVSGVPAIELAQTVGDAGVATPWLALALAAAKTRASGGAQLILNQQGGDLVAMICRKKT